MYIYINQQYIYMCVYIHYISTFIIYIITLYVYKYMVYVLHVYQHIYYIMISTDPCIALAYAQAGRCLGSLQVCNISHCSFNAVPGPETLCRLPQLCFYIYIAFPHCCVSHPHETPPCSFTACQLRKKCTLHYITAHYITLHTSTYHYITYHYITCHYITYHYTKYQNITSHYMTLHAIS